MVAQQRQEAQLYLLAWAVVLAWGCLHWPDVQLTLLVLAALCSVRARFTFFVGPGTKKPPEAPPTLFYHMGNMSRSLPVGIPSSMAYATAAQ